MPRKESIFSGDIYKTNHHGEIKIIKKIEDKKGYFLVEFLETGIQVESNRSNIKAGKVKDPTRKIRYISKVLDLTDTKVGYLTVLEKVEKPKHLVRDGTYWKCKCVCGKEIIKNHSVLARRDIKSCGCKNDYKHPTTHNMSNTKLYNVWKSMRGRCYRKSDKRYKYYGGKGVTICDEWRENFMGFYEWSIRNGYKENQGLSIDRIEVNGNYEPKNCRWVTAKEQANNTTTNKIIEYKGVKLTLSQWCDKLNLSYPTTIARLSVYGWSVEDAFGIPIGTKRSVRTR